MNTQLPSEFQATTSADAQREFETRITQLQEAGRLDPAHAAHLREAALTTTSYEAWSEQVEVDCDRLGITGAERVYLHTVPESAASGIEPLTWADATRRSMQESLQQEHAAVQRHEHDSMALSPSGPSW